MDGWIGQIIAVGFNYEPSNWMKCDGRPLSIAQYPSLFNLIGTTYGGDGMSNFRIPDLRGRLPIHQGQGAGLSGYSLGQSGGEESHTILQSEIPNHTHSLMAQDLASAGQQ